MHSTDPYTFLDKNQLPFPFCPGCGHGTILKALDQALVGLNYDPQQVVIVTDIGCAGLSDRYFKTHAFHGLHGRSVTYATGIKLANPDLKVIVLIGDGGCGIGGHHLINAARRNIGITTLVFNNLNYGMTGGEHSVTTPSGAVTSTTRYGQIEHPMDICGTVAINGANFVARSTTFEPNLTALISVAIQNEGFSLVDIWELCTAYFAPSNKFGKSTLIQTIETLGFETGILKKESKPAFYKAYQMANQEIIDQPTMIPLSIDVTHKNNLNESQGIIIAGAAGTKIGSAASIFAIGAMCSGLWVTQRDDYPVTVKSGHSISELILSPAEILCTGIDTPDIMVVLYQEGLIKTTPIINQLTAKDTLIISADLPVVETHAQKITIDFKYVKGIGKKKEYRAILAMAFVLHIFKFYPHEAFKQAIELRPKFAQENLAAIEEYSQLSYRIA